MKRRHSHETDASNKKQRRSIASDIFEDDSLNNCFCNVDGLTGAVGYFTGSVKMIWDNVPKKRMLSLDVRCCVSENRSHKTVVNLEGDWVELMEAKLGATCIMDQVEISLDGVTSLRAADSQSVKLIYKDGVILRRSRKADSCFVNTWQLQEQQKAVDDLNDWFATPALPITARLSEVARKSSSGGPRVSPVQEEPIVAPKKDAEGSRGARCKEPSATERQVALPEEKRTPAHVNIDGEPSANPKSAIPESAIPIAQQSVTLSDQPQPVSSKSRRLEKKEKKKRKRAQLAAAKAAERQAQVHERVAQPPIVSTSNAASTPQVPAQVPIDAGPQVVGLSQIGMEKTMENTPDGWIAQLQRLQHRYTKLDEATKPRTIVGIIGFVKGYKPPKACKDGWTSNVYLQDPSLFGDAESYSSRDFTIAFFQKHFKEWLPQVTAGDILVVRGIRLQERDGKISGVGYHDRAQWIVYSVSQECTIQPQLGNAPEDQELVDGGFRHSPFIKSITEAEAQYCARLSGWWKEKNKGVVEGTGQVIQLSRGVFDQSRRVPRQHRLFCDAGPHKEPNGYFDCTFEVLNGFRNDNGVYSLFMTDYTTNSEVAACQAQWCPPGLNDFVVRFELWDEAAKMGETFKAGSYYSVRNARMVRARNGYVEGKIVERKIIRLDPEDNYEHLKALLERKKEWQKQNEKKRSPFLHKLIKDAQDGQYMNCTVELVHVSRKADEAHIYVTDYTVHPSLSSDRYEEQWSQGLDQLILSIVLRGPQSQAACNLHPGSFLMINNLRLKHSIIANKFQGELGGNEMLIHRLNVENPNDELRALLKRKDEWKERGNRRKIQDLREQKASKLAERVNSTIEELNTSAKELLKARVIARVIDYYPRQPAQWIRTWCSMCKQRIPEDKRACYQCQDFDHEYVRYKFELMLRIEDRKGNRTDVFMWDGCDFLHGLERGDCVQSPAILSEFVKRLRPLLGDLCHTRDQNVPEKETELATDFVALIIGRYKGVGPDTTRILLAVEN